MKTNDAVLLNPDVVQGIRQAAASERAAGSHEDKYANQMKSAGAAMYAAFRDAMMEQPDWKGRKIGEHVVKRVYESSKPRPWWDAYLEAAKFVDEKGAAKRDDARRLIQWHVDPAGAQTRRAQRQLQQAAAQRRLREKRREASQGMTSSPKSEPSTATMRAIGNSATEEGVADVSLEDLLGECSRLQSAAKKVEAGHRAEAMLAVRNAARQIERYVP